MGTRVAFHFAAFRYLLSQTYTPEPDTKQRKSKECCAIVFADCQGLSCMHVQAIDTQLCINGFYVHTGKAMTISENNGKLRR